MILLSNYISGQYKDERILAFFLKPGIIKSDLARNSNAMIKMIASRFFYPTDMGAFNQLYTGTSPQLTEIDSGKYFIPWVGRLKLVKVYKTSSLQKAVEAFRRGDGGKIFNRHHLIVA